MTPPHFKPRGHGLRRPTFHYQSEDVDCQYCTNYSKENPCPLCECTCLGERIETGSLSLAKVIEDCLRGKLRMRLWKRLAQEIYPYPLQAFHSDEHRSRWMHWRTRCRRLSQRNQAALFLLTSGGEAARPSHRLRSDRTRFTPCNPRIWSTVPARASTLISLLLQIASILAMASLSSFSHLPTSTAVLAAEVKRIPRFSTRCPGGNSRGCRRMRIPRADRGAPAQ